MLLREHACRCNVRDRGLRLVLPATDDSYRHVRVDDVPHLEILIEKSMAKAMTRVRQQCVIGQRNGWPRRKLGVHV